MCQEIGDSEKFVFDRAGDPNLNSAADVMIGEPDPFSSYVALYDEFFPRGLHEDTLVAAANRMTELEPNSPEGYAIRASLMSNRLTPAELLSDLNRAIELDDNYLLPQNLLAAVYIETEKFHEAIAMLKKAIELAPNDPDILEYKTKLENS